MQTNVIAVEATVEKSDHTVLSWFVTVTASLFFFYTFIQLNIFNAIDKELMQTFHLNATALGNLGSIYFYADALFLLPAGLLLDRFSTKKMLLFLVFITIIGTFLFAIATDYFLAAFARFLIGAAAAFSFLSCIRIASRWFPARKMALVSGVIVTMAMLGGLVAQTPMALLSSAIGWRQAMLLDAGLGIIIFIAILSIVQNYPPGSQDKMQADRAHLKNLGLRQSIQLVVLNPQNWLGGIYTSLMNLPVFLLGAIWGIHYLTEVHHVTLLEASYATTIFFVGVILGCPVFGWISDHIGRRVLPMILGAVISFAVILYLMYMPDLSLISIMILFFLIGFVTSSQVLSYPLIAELNPPALTSTAISIVSITIMMGGVIFQPLFGWIMSLGWDGAMMDGAPIYSSQNLLLAMWIIPIAFVVGFSMTFLMKETNCEPKK